jgi:Rieske 2Fe-2S family protein
MIAGVEGASMSDLTRIGALLRSRRPGHTLPQALYNDPEAFAFDLEAVFARSWLLIGFEVELPRPGSFMALTIGAWPILVVRDRQGEIRAFHNVCRHRGAQICPDGTGTSARLVCPYHRWTYELTGELVSAQRMGEGFEPNEHRLGPVHVANVGGVLYVCLAPTPPPIADFQARFTPLIAPHNLKDAKLAFQSSLYERGNWKLVMENGRECYHCAGQHPELSGSFPIETPAYFDFGEDQRARAFAERMAAAGIPMGPEDGGWWEAIRFPLNEGFVSMTVDGAHAVKRLMCPAGDGDVGSLRLAVEPHAFCHATADHVFLFTVLPLGPQESLVQAKWLVHKDAVEGVDYTIEGLTRLWTETNLQDRLLVENNQRGVSSPGYRPGPFSPEAETLALRFCDWYCATAARYVEETLMTAPARASRRAAAER